MEEMDRLREVLVIASGEGTRRERVDKIKPMLKADFKLFRNLENCFQMFRPPECEHMDRKYPAQYDLYATLCMALAEITGNPDDRKNYGFTGGEVLSEEAVRRKANYFYNKKYGRGRRKETK